MFARASTSRLDSGKKKELDSKQTPRLSDRKPLSAAAASAKTSQPAPSKPAPKEKEPAKPPIQLRTPTEHLLFGILQELQMRNGIEFRKLREKDKEKQEELEAAQKYDEEDQANFEEYIKPKMFM